MPSSTTKSLPSPCIFVNWSVVIGRRASDRSARRDRFALDMSEQLPPQRADPEPDCKIDHAHDETGLPPLGLRHVTRAVHYRTRTDSILGEAPIDVAQDAKRDRRGERRNARSNHQREAERK